MGLFGGRSGSAASQMEKGRTSRHSSGWAQMQKHLRTSESLRILDIGPTSAGNINFITGLGHSIYMANLVDDANRPEYHSKDADGVETYDAARFLAQNLDFAGRTFDVVTFWDTADYLPEPLVQPVVDRIYEVMTGGGQLLALFHSKTGTADTTFSRYHLTDRDEIELQPNGSHPLLHTYTNREVETLFRQYSGHKFFLAKDALREVIVTR